MSTHAIMRSGAQRHERSTRVSQEGAQQHISAGEEELGIRPFFNRRRVNLRARCLGSSVQRAQGWIAYTAAST
jgi:hypothetical protein